MEIGDYRGSAMSGKKEPTQRTQPKKGEPVEIPVPKRKAWNRLLRKVAQPKPANGEQGKRPPDSR